MSVINTNVAANNTYRLMSMASEDKASSMEKLSSGLRINRAADDAAGLSIAEGLKSQSNGLEIASRNAQDAINLIQTAEGGLASAHDILQRMRDLAVQGGNDTNNADARTAIRTEVSALANELVRMSESINFDGTKLLDGSRTGDPSDTVAGRLTFQIGAEGAASDQITLDLGLSNLSAIVGDADGTGGLAIGKVESGQFTLNADVLDTSKEFSDFVTALDTAIGKVSTERSMLGATQNRLEHTIKHVNVAAENLSAAESSIRDVDMAKEIVKQSAASIKEQAAQAMLAQANQASQGVLQLLR